MVRLTPEQFAVAKAAGEALMGGPRVRVARYDEKHDQIVLFTKEGIVRLRAEELEGLEDASADDLKLVEVSSDGLSIRFPTLGQDFWVPTMLEGKP